MGRLTGDARRVSVSGQAADPSSPSGPERAPYFRRVRSVHLHGAVGGGGPFVATHWSRLIGRRTGIDQQRNVVHIHQAAESVGVRVARQRRRARRGGGRGGREREGGVWWE